MRQQIIGKQFDEERALYYLQHSDVVDCVFAGPADGESVLKEARDVGVVNCSFSLRYPLWHVQGFKMERSSMDELTRAAIWYACDGGVSVPRQPRCEAGKCADEGQVFLPVHGKSRNSGFLLRYQGCLLAQQECDGGQFYLEG